MTPQPAAMHDALAALFNEYYQALPALFVEVQDCWKHVGEEKAQGPHLMYFFRHIHNLAGKSGTYGMQDVGDAARNLDHMLLQIIEAGRVPTPDECKVIESALTQIITLSQPFIERAKQP